MRKIVFVAAALLALGAAPGSAEARPGGCIKYGLGGAVAGQIAGGHRWKGAAIGCALGILKRRQDAARNRELGRSRTVERNRYDERGPNYGNRYDDRGPSYGRDRTRNIDRDETGSTGGFGRGGAFIRGGS